MFRNFRNILFAFLRVRNNCCSIKCRISLRGRLFMNSFFTPLFLHLKWHFYKNLALNKKVFPRSSIFLLSYSAVVWVCIIEGAIKEFQGFSSNLFLELVLKQWTIYLCKTYFPVHFLSSFSTKIFPKLQNYLIASSIIVHLTKNF